MSCQLAFAACSNMEGGTSDELDCIDALLSAADEDGDAAETALGVRRDEEAVVLQDDSDRLPWSATVSSVNRCFTFARPTVPFEDTVVGMRALVVDVGPGCSATQRALAADVSAHLSRVRQAASLPALSFGFQGQAHLAAQIIHLHSGLRSTSTTTGAAATGAGAAGAAAARVGVSAAAAGFNGAAAAATGSEEATGEAAAAEAAAKRLATAGAVVAESVAAATARAGGSSGGEAGVRAVPGGAAHPDTAAARAVGIAPALTATVPTGAAAARAAEAGRVQAATLAGPASAGAGASLVAGAAMARATAAPTRAAGTRAAETGAALAVPIAAGVTAAVPVFCAPGAARRARAAGGLAAQKSKTLTKATKLNHRVIKMPPFKKDFGCATSGPSGKTGSPGLGRSRCVCSWLKRRSALP